MMGDLKKIHREIIDRIESDNGDMIPRPVYQYQIERYCRSWKRTIDLRVAGGEYDEMESTQKMIHVDALMGTVNHMDAEWKLRKKLLNWHYQKSLGIGIVELLDSNYQSFRYKVAHRVENNKLDFREAIKIASFDELMDLQVIIDEERLRI